MDLAGSWSCEVGQLCFRTLPAQSLESVSKGMLELDAVVDSCIKHPLPERL